MPASPSSDPAVETEARILEAARRVFLRRGTAGARMQEIADEAGVNKALLHYYFRSKEKLSEAVFLGALRTLLPQMLIVLASDLPLRDKLEQVVAAELDMLAANPSLPGYVLSEFQHHPERIGRLVADAVPDGGMRQATLATLQRQLDAEAEAGRLRPARAEDFLVTLMALLVFPFAAAPMLDAVLGLGRSALDALAARRRADLPDLILRAFRPD